MNGLKISLDERGNVLFLILIAVALFGALSFAVSNMMRGGENARFTQEQVNLYAGEILDSALQIRNAVQEARISFDCQDTDISFANNFISGYEHSPAAPDGCQIFHESLGSVNYSTLPADWLDSARSGFSNYGDWYFTGQSCVFDVGTGTTDCLTANGVSDSELIAIVPWVKREICVAINDALGIDNPGGDPPQSSTDAAWDGDFDRFVGLYDNNGVINSAGTDVAALTAQVNGCFEAGGDPAAGSYHFYQVLIAR